MSQSAVTIPLQEGDLVAKEGHESDGTFGRIVQRIEYVQVNWSDGASSEVPLSSLKRHSKLNSL